MKKLMFFLILAAALCSFKFAYDATNKTAETAKIDGILVFTDCEPVKPYDKLGEVKKSLSISNGYIEVRDGLIKKAKKEFPNCDGVILYFSSNGLSADKAQVIKFK